jgi:hypothetical protein
MKSQEEKHLADGGETAESRSLGIVRDLDDDLLDLEV